MKQISKLSLTIYQPLSYIDYMINNNYKKYKKYMIKALKRFSVKSYDGKENGGKWFIPKIKDFDPSNKDVKRISKELEDVRATISNHKESIENQGNQLEEIDSAIKDTIQLHTNGTLNNKEFEDKISELKSSKSKAINSIDSEITERIIESLKAKELELSNQLEEHKDNATKELVSKKVKALDKQLQKLNEVALNYETELHTASQIATDIKRLDANYNKNGLQYSRIYNNIDTIAVSSNEVITAVANLVELDK